MNHDYRVSVKPCYCWAGSALPVAYDREVGKKFCGRYKVLLLQAVKEWLRTGLNG
jgi:hypothetical protein